VPCALALALPLLALVACSGDDGGGGSDQGQNAGSNGLLVGQRLEDGELADTLEVLDPDEPDGETVAVADVARGIAVGVNQALYESGADVVLLDAEAREVHGLDLLIGEIDLAYSRSAVAPGGDRFVVLLSPTGEGAALVDLEEAEVTDLIAPLGGPELVLGAEMADDGSQVLLNTEDGVFLVPTDDPGSPERLGDGAGQLLAGGSSVLLTGVDGVVVREVDGDEETVVSDGAGGALAVGDRILVGRDDEAVLLDPGSDDVIASAPFSTAGAAPVAVGDAVLLPGGEAPTWTLIDGTAGTATEVPELEGLTPAFNGRPSRWVPFQDAEAGRVLGVDLEDGSVETVLELEEGEQLVGLPAVADAGPAALVSVDDEDGTRGVVLDLDTGDAEELGRAVQGATFSPDGTQLAWSVGEEAELRVAPVDDLGAAEVVGEGIALPVWLNGG